MDYQLTELQQEIRDIARRIADERIKPVRAQYDEDDHDSAPRCRQTVCIITTYAE